MTKEQQLKKTKQLNAKRMSPIELANYKNFIYARSGGMCQCGCSRELTEYHHVFFGINKDDRYLAAIAQHPCHYNIHHGKDVEEKKRLIEIFERVGKENWGMYTL